MAEKTPEPKKVRVRETRKGDPVGFGGVRHDEHRILEIDAPAPEGAEIVTDKPHDWRTIH